MTDTLLQLDQVTRTDALPRERLWGPPPLVHAVRGISLRMRSGKTLGVVGESGSGKSTLARLVMALEEPTSGSVRLLGQSLGELAPAALRAALPAGAGRVRDAATGAHEPGAGTPGGVPLRNHGGDSAMKQNGMVRTSMASRNFLVQSTFLTGEAS